MKIIRYGKIKMFFIVLRCAISLQRRYKCTWWDALRYEWYEELDTRNGDLHRATLRRSKELAEKCRPIGKRIFHVNIPEKVKKRKEEWKQGVYS